ncbi:DNA-primase RepB domain-containing protein [Roseovarius sp.]|jgi:hypothetical protein
MDHPAIAFLRKLDASPVARFNIEVYTDAAKSGEKPKLDPLSRRCAGLSLDDVVARLPTLEDLNEQGAAIYVAVNEFDGHRRRENLVRVRGVHADLDGVENDTLEAIRARLKPTIEVQTSSPQHWHFYWLLAPGETLAAEQAEAINRGLVELGADPAAVDVARLLRLPGFRHMKHAEQGEQHA